MNHDDDHQIQPQQNRTGVTRRDLEQSMAVLQTYIDQRLKDREHWADEQRAATKAALEAVRELIDERDRRYAELGTAQKTAVDAALTAAQTAVTAALTAAEKATDKAERASAIRFEGFNEFNERINILTRSFVPTSTLEAFQANIAEWKQGVEQRLNLRQGSDEGTERNRAHSVEGIGLLQATVSIIIAIAVLGVILFAALHK